MRSRVRPIVITLIVGAAAVIFLFALSEYKNNEVKAKTEVTKERLQEVKKNATVGAMVVLKKDSSVDRVSRVSCSTSVVDL